MNTQRHSRTPSRPAGFTLMELLVALAVIALVAALLLPLLARPRDRVRQTVCASNLRQIGVATLQYVQDNDGRLPPHHSAADGFISWAYGSVPNRVHWTISYSRGMLSPYVKNASIWHCPSVADLDRKDGGPNAFPDYGINGVLTSHLSGRASVQAISLSQVPSPSETLLMADSLRMIDGRSQFAPDLLPPSAHNPLIQGRHSGEANVLWLDGHVQAMRPIASYTNRRGDTPAQLNAQNIGDILNSPSTGNAQTDDYYYELTKP